ncbi:UNVERIFIED_CONTAM: hypothetical protein FKN15_052733 [Acipenser sinensis]
MAQNILYTNLTAVENQVLTLKSELASVRAETQGEINSLQKNLTRISQELQSTNQKYTQAMESKQAADSLNQEHLSKIKALEEELSALSGVNRPVPVHTITALYIAALLMALPVSVTEFLGEKRQVQRRDEITLRKTVSTEVEGFHGGNNTRREVEKFFQESKQNLFRGLWTD